MFPIIDLYEINIYHKTRIWNDINRLGDNAVEEDFTFKIEAVWNRGYPPTWTVHYWFEDFKTCEQALGFLDKELSFLIHAKYLWAKENYNNSDTIKRGEARGIIKVLETHRWIEKGGFDGKKEEETEDSTTNTSLKKGGTCMVRDS